MATVRPARNGKPGRWEARLYAGIDPLTGREIRPSRSITAPNRREAQREADRLELDLRDGETSSDSGTMGEILDAWLVRKARTGAPSAVRDARSKVETYLRRPLGRLPVERITPPMLDQLYGEFARRGGACTHRPCRPPDPESMGQPCGQTTRAGTPCQRRIGPSGGCGKHPPAGKPAAPWACPEHAGACADWTPCETSPCEHGGPLSTSSVVRLHSVIHSALALAVDWGWLRRNPADRAEPGTPEQVEIEPPEREDVIALLARAEDLDPRLACHLAVAIETGARRGAMHALRWSDWSGPREDKLSTLTLRRVLSIGTGGPVERTAARNKRGGRATLGPHVTAALSAHHDQMFARALAAEVALPADAHMWSDDVMGERPWHPDSTTHRFARIRGDATTRLHDLRHLMATQLLAAGVSPRVVAERGGWQQLHTMLGTYAHSTPAADTAAAGVVDRLLGDGE